MPIDTKLVAVRFGTVVMNYVSDALAVPAPQVDVVEIQMGARQRFIITREPEHVKTVLTTKFKDFGKGPNIHRQWSPFLGNSIFTTDAQQWHDSRSLIRPMFIKNRISDLTIFERCTAHMMSKIEGSGLEVDIMDLFYRMTLDATTEFLLGANINSLDNPAHDFAKAFNDVQRIQMAITLLGPFSSFLPKGPYLNNIQMIDDFVMPYVEAALALPADELERITKSDRDFTFLHSIVQYTRDKKLLRDHLVAILLAGRDTTAATLSWALYELSRYPEKVRLLREEILSVLGTSRTPNYEDLKNFVYLRRILNETLRLYPAVPFNLRTALVDSRLEGTDSQPPISVVKGDTVIYSPLSMHRRKDLYPPVSDTFADPGTFSPERWEHWTPRPWQYLPFNGGPRICVGQNFALTEMAYVIVRMLQKYERIEYVGDWAAQYYVTELVLQPGQGVCLRFFK
ncbi:hypothetical protein EKO27_g6378 [Xylaria grammica]|uniref:Cytochrome P450 n=1 Tax=Xylaria grammica TaxID=363999 RepID=A0A439D2V5_9PEZI|nr:hypothetical protein EKO27_g6378 [Xylaria grammica]